LIEYDILFILCCKVEDNTKKIREKSVESIMMIAYNEKIGPNLVGDVLFKRINE